MPTTAYDLGYLRAAADLLKKYLLSKDIYWKINSRSPAGEPPYPSLTIGGMLLSQRRLQARHLDSKMGEIVSQLNHEIDRIKSKWRSAWEEKALGEFRMRLNLWRDYLEEFRSRPKANINRYSYEISRRVMLQLLSGELRQIPHAEREMLAGLDSILAALLVNGDFIWQADLAAGFSPDDFPYLYGTLRH